jgi:hypothetical protein
VLPPHQRAGHGSQLPWMKRLICVTAALFCDGGRRRSDLLVYLKTTRRRSTAEQEFQNSSSAGAREFFHDQARERKKGEGKVVQVHDVMGDERRIQVLACQGSWKLGSGGGSDSNAASRVHLAVPRTQVHFLCSCYWCRAPWRLLLHDKGRGTVPRPESPKGRHHPCSEPIPASKLRRELKVDR